MKKTHARLADGREIIYFDESDNAVRPEVDRRHLDPSDAQSELRFDIFTGEWVTVAAHRQDRTYLPPVEECPLCPSAEGRLTEVPASSYDVVVFENRFPSYRAGPAGRAPADAGGFGHHPGVGRCEVVCFTSNHDSSFSALSPERVRTVMDAWADRTEDLQRVEAIAQVFPFENRGREIGVTLSHPHGQIYGYPFVTPRTERAMEVARRYRDLGRGDLYADQLAAEVDAAVRVVARTAYWTAVVPYASRWPLEVHLYPNRRVGWLPDLEGPERDDFALAYLDVLGRLEHLYGDDLPYIAGWQQLPKGADPTLGYLHLELASIRRAPGKLKYLAGSEASMHAWVNDRPPEQVAAELRDAKVGQRLAS